MLARWSVGWAVAAPLAVQTIVRSMSIGLGCSLELLVGVWSVLDANLATLRRVFGPVDMTPEDQIALTSQGCVDKVATPKGVRCHGQLCSYFLGKGISRGTRSKADITVPGPALAKTRFVQTACPVADRTHPLPARCCPYDAVHAMLPRARRGRTA